MAGGFTISGLEDSGATITGEALTIDTGSMVRGLGSVIGITGVGSATTVTGDASGDLNSGGAVKAYYLRICSSMQS